jgi:hypothetical protein
VQIAPGGGAVRLIGVGSEAVVSQPDLLACGDGVVHVIDTLLLPVRLSAGAAAAPASAAAAAAPAAASAASSVNTVIIEKAPPVFASGGAAGRRMMQAAAPLAAAAPAPAPGAQCLSVEQARVVPIAKTQRRAHRSHRNCAHHSLTPSLSLLCCAARRFWPATPTRRCSRRRCRRCLQA